MNVRQLLDFASTKLKTGASARFDAEILMGFALDVNRSFLYANPQVEVPAKRRSLYLRLVKRRCQGEPIAYIIEKRSFWTLELHVSPDVLIPRPETELLVETALERIPLATQQRVADLGTGSGAIALSIASERPSCEIHASETSTAALAIAKNNAQRHQLNSVTFHRGSWAEPLQGDFNMIVSNPPYVPSRDPHLHTGDCRFEPVDALSPGVTGLESFEQIVPQAKRLLVPGGWLLFEHGFDQGKSVRSMLEKAGFDEISTICDLAGLERVCLGKQPA
jgi:release factor glutamine methyltransferase